MKLFEIKKESPEWLLAESSKNLHLEHLEDLIFNSGYSGALEALNYVESLRIMFAEGTGNPTRLTVKWDGSPAIVCGTDPADGKFFVGTKSVFNKVTPKLCKSTRHIEAYYGEQPELKEKLVRHLESNRIQTRNYFAGNLLLHPAYKHLGDAKDYPNAGQYSSYENMISNLVDMYSKLWKLE